MAHIPGYAQYCLIAAVLFWPARSASADDDYTVRASTNGGGSQWTPQGWSATTHYSEIKDYTDRPTELTSKTITVEWQQPELDALGNMCTLRGQLKWSGPAQQPTKTINWFQGIAVYLAMAPDAKPDWSMGMNQTDSLSETAATSPSGRFQMRFDMRQSKYDRAQTQQFQFGIALAKHTVKDKANQSVIWDSHTPAIPSTVQMLTVPAAPALSRELQLINRASGWPSSSNGVELIRAVNVLQPLGKVRALHTLDKYLKLTQQYDRWREQEVVFWIIRLLFEPIQLGERIPVPGIYVWLRDDQSVEVMKWPLNPIANSDNTPFMLGTCISGTGSPEQPSSHIRWARQHAIIRDSLLIPSANPLAAAEAILQSRRYKALDNDSRSWTTPQVRTQALAMIKGLVKPVDDGAEITDELWQTRLKEASERGIHWDAKREEFVSRK